MRNIFVLIIFAFSIFNYGCSTVGKGMDKTKELVGLETPYEIDGQPTTRFSEAQYMPPQTDRQYEHMTRSRLEEESNLHAGAGSMWVMEGQGAYLFSQNKTRKEGDLLNVKVEGAAQKQIETKVSVIKKLLKQLEEEERRLREGANSDTKLAEGQQGAARAPASASAAEKDEPINVESVPTRITERQPDGSYRVKGQQPFMIGNREYKVIVTGLVRAEDFNDLGVSSNVLLDPQYDVVTMRKVSKQ